MSDPHGNKGQPDCFRCADEMASTVADPLERAMIVGSHMFLCLTCGNKRCPKATDHRHDCTGSNEPGQPGSRYGYGPVGVLTDGFGSKGQS